jgi:hypothetical protein
METITTGKESKPVNLLFKIFLCLTFLAVGAIKTTLTAQSLGKDSLKYWKLNTTNDHFWEPHCPTASSLMDGYTLWLLRQKMTLDAYQTILNNEINLDHGTINKIQFTNYMPLMGEGNFNSMLGTQYSKFDMQSEDDSLKKSIQMVWLWTAWQYKYKRWNFTFTTETSYRGDENTLYTKTGDQLTSIVYFGYELNNRWNIILLGRYKKQEMLGQSKDESIVGIQARYQPSNKFKLLFGAPCIFSAEWTALPKTDIGLKYTIYNESYLFIRQRLSKKVGVSVQYNSLGNNSEGTYFNNTMYNAGGNNKVIFNKVAYLQQQVFAGVNFNLYKDIGFSIGAGYNFSNKMNLFNNNDKVYNGINSKDNLFVNFSLQFARVK